MNANETCRTAATALLALALTSARVHAGQSYVDFSADYLHDDNIGRAENEADRLDDDVFSAAAALQIPQLAGPHSGWLHTLSIAYDRHTDWEDLSRLSVTGGTTLRYKPGSGFRSPWFEPNLSLSLLEHQDSDIRDGTLLRTGLIVGSNLTDRLTARLSYRYDWRQSWDSDVFDLDSHRISGSFDFAVGTRATLYGNLGWQTGEIISTATPSPKVLNASAARALDEALSQRPPGARRSGNYFEGDRVAYRLDGDTLTGEIGINVAITRKLALDLSALHFDAWGDGNNDYDGLQVRAGLLYRY